MVDIFKKRISIKYIDIVMDMYDGLLSHVKNRDNPTNVFFRSKLDCISYLL